MSEILLFLGTEEDKAYAPHLKPCVGTATVFTLFRTVNTLAEVVAYCKAPGTNGKSRGITGVISTNQHILKKLLAAMGNHKEKVSLNDYQGSYFCYQGIEFVFISPLAQLFTVPYGKFIARRFISKLSAPELWKKNPEFTWEVMTASNQERLFAQFQSAIMIGVDIETQREGLRIDSISYTALFLDKATGKFTSHTAVLEVDSMYAVAIMRKFNAQLKAPKALQNGKYDVSYLCRYGAPLYNWLWDTQNMFHCWYAELPKDLGFLAAFHVREIVYWKDLAQSPDKMEQLRYNALDTWTTILVVMNWLLEAPEWAKRNYKMEFPLNFALHLSEMTGIKRDMEALAIASEEVNEKIDAGVSSLSRMLGMPAGILFNTNSPPQNTRLRKVLGCADIDSSDEKNLKKIALRHPLNARIVNKILDIRGWRKLEGTYLKIATPAHLIPDMKKKDIVEGSELEGTNRILYSINPTTETGRNASKEHHFWCGLNIQNQPRGPEVKKTFIADDDFMFAECDLKQAESRDTGYLAGEENLIAAVSGTRDFHAVNASAFFGTPYEQIFDDATAKTLDKKLRDLAKRTNHGANYLMGEQVMIDTMGEDKVWEAKRLLNLPKSYGLKEVAHHLLEAFHATYPGLRKTYYPAVVHEVMTTRMLKHHAVINEPETYAIDGPVWKTDWELEPLEGWTRYCFGNPEKNKLDKNSYVAHVSQGFNARKLNVAYLRVFYEIALNPKYAPHFKLCAQIHDSILFQFRKGHEYLMDMVRERMEVAAKVKGYDGNIRTYTVPADTKAGKDGMGALRWSETE